MSDNLDVRVPARDDEEFRYATVVVDRNTWRTLAGVARARGTTRSHLLRRYIQWEVKRARARGEIA